MESFLSMNDYGWYETCDVYFDTVVCKGTVFRHRLRCGGLIEGSDADGFYLRFLRVINIRIKISFYTAYI